MEFQFYFGDKLIQLGFVLSLLLSLAFIFRSFKRNLELYLAAFFGCTAGIFAIKILFNTGEIINYPHGLWVDIPLRFLRPVMLLFYIALLQRTLKRVGKLDLLHFIIPLLVLFHYLPEISLSAAEKNLLMREDLLLFSGTYPSHIIFTEYFFNLIYKFIFFFIIFIIYIIPNT